MRGLLTVALTVLVVSAPARAETDCTNEERAAYFDAIEQQIHEYWRIPYDNRPISCKVLVKLDFRGEVRDVGIARCGEDPAVHRSIMNAAYRASPMPMPAKKSCFARSVIVTIESRTQQGD
jgi:hypothetical protein